MWLSSYSNNYELEIKKQIPVEGIMFCSSSSSADKCDFIQLTSNVSAVKLWLVCCAYNFNVLWKGTSIESFIYVFLTMLVKLRNNVEPIAVFYEWEQRLGYFSLHLQLKWTMLNNKHFIHFLCWIMSAIWIKCNMYSIFQQWNDN